jgi:ankyrin repeat protein
MGADPNIKTQKEERTALFDAVEAGHPDIVRMLLKAGADPDVQDICGFTPLMRLVIQNDERNGRDWFKPEVLHALIEGGANIEARGVGNKTALLTAAASNNLAYVKELLKNGAQPDVKDQFGRNPFDITVMSGSGNKRTQCARYLKELMAKQTISDKGRAR